MKILRANPRGFCAGVDRAILIVERLLEMFGSPVYVRHEIVHNRYVVADLSERGAVFVDELSEVPDGAVVVFSAHGVSKAVQDEGKARDLSVFDATCPLVSKVHMEVIRAARNNHDLVLIGHEKHAEVEGTMGQFFSEVGQIYLVQSKEEVATLRVNQPDALHYVTQTTLSVDDTASIISALQEKFPNIQGPKKDDICYATQNRQDAVRSLAKVSDVVLVVGSTNSSNSNRLQELAEHLGTPAYLLDDPKQLEAQWLDGVETLGITAGASAPEVLVKSVIEAVEALVGESVAVEDLEGPEESVHFALPGQLRYPEAS